MKEVTTPKGVSETPTNQTPTRKDIDLLWWLDFFCDKDPGPTIELSMGREGAYRAIRAVLEDYPRVKELARFNGVTVLALRDDINQLNTDLEKTEAEVERLRDEMIDLKDDLALARHELAAARPLLEAVRVAPVFTLKSDIKEIDDNASKFWGHEPMPGIAYIVSANRDILYQALALKQSSGKEGNRE